jgi:hypothetical protein
MATRMLNRWMALALALAVLVGVGVQVAPTASAVEVSSVSGVTQLSLDNDSLRLAGEGRLMFSGRLALSTEARIVGLRVTVHSIATQVLLNGERQVIPKSGTLERLSFVGQVEVYGEATVVFRRANVRRFRSQITGRAELISNEPSGRNWYRINGEDAQSW